MEMGRAEADAMEYVVDYYSNCSYHANYASRVLQSQKKCCSIQAIAFGGNQSRLAMRGWKTTPNYDI